MRLSKKFPFFSVSNSKPEVRLPTGQELGIILKKLEERLNEVERINQTTGSDTVAIKAVTGRSSIDPEQTRSLNNLSRTVVADWDFSFIKSIQDSAMFNRHVSLATENIVNLASTDFKITFSPEVNREQARLMIRRLKTAWGNWYNFSDGLFGLIDDLFAQLATSGAISVECVPTGTLDGIDKIYRVNPADIRFTFDRETGEYMPWQKITGVAAVESVNVPTSLIGHVRLNPNTYFYTAARRITSKPYGVPPFITVLHDLIIESNMTTNFQSMMKKLGMLGFLRVLITAPRQGNLTNDDYETKVANFLRDHAEIVSNGLSEGYTVGIKDTHEMDVVGNTSNVVGAEGLMNIIQNLIFQGIKQDPTLHGQNFSTTETFARVVLARTSKMVENYQRKVASFLERLFLNHLFLSGFSFEFISVVFEKPMVGDVKRQREAEGLHINNLLALWRQGIIDNQRIAEEVGEDEPNQMEPRVSSNGAAESGVSDPDNDSPDNPSPDTSLSKKKPKPKFIFRKPQKSNGLLLN